MPRRDVPGHWVESRPRPRSPIEIVYNPSTPRNRSDRMREIDDFAQRYQDQQARDRRARIEDDMAVPAKRVIDGAALVRAALLGPTVREIRPRDKTLPALRYIKESDGKEYAYKHVKNIGVGGQGQCDLYQRSNSSKLIVCKVMKYGFPQINLSSGRRKPYEAHLLHDLLSPHPLIIDLHSFNSSTFYLEYCSMGDLMDLSTAYLAHRTPVPESFIWHAYHQLAIAFAYIHTGYTPDHPSYPKPNPKFQPIVHRDVKPSNIFIRPNPHAPYPDLVLADFGIATTDVVSARSGAVGTPLYQPPEVPLHSPEGDIWSLGACIHVLATGSPPMMVKPSGWDMGEWYEAPEARAVADLRSLGYSGNLHAGMLWALRRRRGDRVTGRELVGRVGRGEGECVRVGGRVWLREWVGRK